MIDLSGQYTKFHLPDQSQAGNEAFYGIILLKTSGKMPFYGI